MQSRIPSPNEKGQEENHAAFFLTSYESSADGMRTIAAHPPPEPRCGH
jgi:hypothetical protein